jgi:hypothetical protein
MTGVAFIVMYHHRPHHGEGGMALRSCFKELAHGSGQLVWWIMALSLFLFLELLFPTVVSAIASSLLLGVKWGLSLLQKLWSNIMQLISKLFKGSEKAEAIKNSENRKNNPPENTVVSRPDDGHPGPDGDSNAILKDPIVDDKVNATVIDSPMTDHQVSNFTRIVPYTQTEVNVTSSIIEDHEVSKDIKVPIQPPNFAPSVSDYARNWVFTAMLGAFTLFAKSSKSIDRI